VCIHFPILCILTSVSLVDIFNKNDTADSIRVSRFSDFIYKSVYYTVINFFRKYFNWNWWYVIRNKIITPFASQAWRHENVCAEWWYIFSLLIVTLDQNVSSSSNPAPPLFGRKMSPMIFWIAGWVGHSIRANASENLNVSCSCQQQKPINPAVHLLYIRKTDWFIQSSLFSCFYSRRFCNYRLSNTFIISSSSYCSC
jgi:hypothetical protein